MRSTGFEKAGIGLYAALLSTAFAGCQAAGPQIGPAMMQRAERSSANSYASVIEKVLLDFDGANGATPTTGLAYWNAALYGTTTTGGSANLGTVYRITPTGSERVLLNFKAGRLSVSPAGPLTPFEGSLYGAADANAHCDSRRAGTCAGVVFAIDKSGKERTVYAFKGGRDGAQPTGALTVLNGDLYGVTSYGGKYGLGTIFRLTTSGSERVLHSFVKPYGIQPTGGLVAVNGVLYGTTQGGGANAEGTVFSITTSGDETVLYSFAGSADGAYPAAGLTELGGMLYGTTAGGGNDECGNGDPCGTVFSIDTSGNETVLHRFDGDDGAYPQAALTAVNDTLYGTTPSGGAYACAVERPCGTVFAMDTSGNLSVVHDFTGSPDGAFPEASLTYVNGTLFGTTQGGGLKSSDYYFGYGTVFTITPSAARLRR